MSKVRYERSFNSPINIEHKIRLTYSFIKKNVYYVVYFIYFQLKFKIWVKNLPLTLPWLFQNFWRIVPIMFIVQGHYKKIDNFMFNQITIFIAILDNAWENFKKSLSKEILMPSEGGMDFI